MENNKTVEEIKIGAIESIARHYVIPKISILLSKYPNIKIKVLNPTNLNKRLNLLEEGVLDIAILKNAENFISVPYEQKLLDTLEYCFFYNPKNIVFQDQISLENLKNYMLISKSYRTKTFDDFLVKNYQNSISYNIEFDNDDLIIETVKIQKAVGYAPKKFIDTSIFKILNVYDAKNVYSQITAFYSNDDDKVKEMIELLK